MKAFRYLFFAVLVTVFGLLCHWSFYLIFEMNHVGGIAIWPLLFIIMLCIVVSGESLKRKPG